jgi:hypothetical protein
MASKGREVFGRKTQFVVMPVESVRMLNVRSNDQVVEAQKAVDDNMLDALEEMVNSARAGKLEGDDVLRMAAIAW